ncbi:ferric reductase [Cenococcum geophilum]
MDIYCIDVKFERFKKHFLDTPFFKTRHYREFKLLTATNVSTLPSLRYFGTNIIFYIIKVISKFYNYTGVLAAITYLFIFIASKGVVISHDYNMALFIFILLHSLSAIRHAFYKTFLYFYIIAISFAVAIVWIYLKGLPQLRIIYSRTCRLILIIIRNISSGGIKANIKVLPGDAIRVTIYIAYLWNDEKEDLSKEKGLATSISIIIYRRTSFTKRLFKKVNILLANKFTTSALIKGLYSGENLISYSTITAILFMPRRHDVLRILLFVTHLYSTKEIYSPSSSGVSAAYVSVCGTSGLTNNMRRAI